MFSSLELILEQAENCDEVHEENAMRELSLSEIQPKLETAYLNNYIFEHNEYTLSESDSEMALGKKQSRR